MFKYLLFSTLGGGLLPIIWASAVLTETPNPERLMPNVITSLVLGALLGLVAGICSWIFKPNGCQQRTH